MKPLYFLLVLSLSPLLFADSIDDVFANPPPAARPRVMWMWMGSNVSKAGITHDLESLKDAGFGGAMMFALSDICTPWASTIHKSPTPDLVAFTDPWWKLVHHAAEESNRLGLDFGMGNCPGYETSGGPWITPELSMQEIVWSQTPVKGPGKISQKLERARVDPHANQMFPFYNPSTGVLEKPIVKARETFYRDIAVLALPTEGSVPKDKVIDLTARMSADGNLSWDAPEGSWTVYRFGYTTKGKLVQPAQWEAQGLECDKMNRAAVEFHMNHVLADVRKHIGPLAGKSFTNLHFDSYEAGEPSWTPNMRKEFQDRRGYDPVPWLPVRAGRIVEGEAGSKKFQQDFKITISDLYRDVYYPTLKKMLNAASLDLSSEPYGGPWKIEEVVPQLDRVLTEFWTSGADFRPYGGRGPLEKAAWASGKPVIEAEAFTGSPAFSKWDETPAKLKRMGDAAFVAGVNRMMLHQFAQQAWGGAFKPGVTMGQWGTHFTQNQTWWEPGKAWVAYLARCQALLQWGKIVPPTPQDFNSDASAIATGDPKKPGEIPALGAIHRREGGSDVYFVANLSTEPVEARCAFSVDGCQPELWDPVRGTKRMLPQFDSAAGKTTVPMRFAPSESYFVVFRKPVSADAAKPAAANFPDLRPGAEISGPWQVQFDPKWGGPKEPLTFDTLQDWTLHPEPGVKYFSGTAVYSRKFDVPAEVLSDPIEVDLGKVNHLARVRINGRNLGVVWTAPWRVAVPKGLLKANANDLVIEVTNVWANRLIGDEQEPDDCQWSPGPRGNGCFLKEFPDWFLKKHPRPSKGRLTFTTWNYFTKDSALTPSGLLGPVQLMREDWTPRAIPEALAFPERRLSAEGAAIVVTARTSKEKLAAFEQDIPGERLTATAQDVVTDKSGGTDASAVINGTTRNGSGGAETLNDGKTYRGYGQGHSLTLRLDAAKSPAGYDLVSILSFAGHQDARAGQRYRVSVSTVDAPDEFKPLAEVNLSHSGGASEVRMTSADGKPLVRRAAAVRFDFADGKSGFQVYREFSLAGSPTTP